MKYNIDWLKEQLDRGERMKFLFFWGHQPGKNGVIKKTCLSQWYESAFEVEGIVYRTAEHWMMAEKARLFDDAEILEQILTAESPGEAKKLGRQVRNFNQQIWEANRYTIVKMGNQHKFEQNPLLKDFLLTSSERILVEASPYDAIWGIGMAESDNGVENPHLWNGPNLLGFALMEVRDALKA